MPEKSSPELMFFGDPMCSWCWGFNPVLNRLANTFDIPMRIFVGGLRPRAMAEPVDDEVARALYNRWCQVRATSEQRFDFRTLKRRGWVYDTETACRAVIAVREERPDQVRPFLERLHRAFYLEGWDLTDPDVYAELSAPFVDSPNELPDRLRNDEELRALTLDDFELATQLGVYRVPTLLIRTDDGARVLSRGYSKFDSIAPALERWIDPFEERKPESLLEQPLWANVRRVAFKVVLGVD